MHSIMRERGDRFFWYCNTLDTRICKTHVNGCVCIHTERDVSSIACVFNVSTYRILLVVLLIMSNAITIGLMQRRHFLPAGEGPRPHGGGSSPLRFTPPAPRPGRRPRAPRRRRCPIAVRAPNQGAWARHARGWCEYSMNIWWIFDEYLMNTCWICDEYLDEYLMNTWWIIYKYFMNIVWIISGCFITVITDMKSSEIIHKLFIIHS